MGFDLEDGASWDFVPGEGGRDPALVAGYQQVNQMLHKAWWLARRAYGSQARLAYGSVYEVPSSLGRFDIAVVGCLLLHLRDPFRALESVSQLVDESLVVVDIVPGLPVAEHADFNPPPPGPLPADTPAAMWFMPDPVQARWWSLSPGAVAKFLNVLGFGKTAVRYHRQRIGSVSYWLYTVVGRR